MGLKRLIEPFPWTHYSKKIQLRLRRLRYCGSFTSQTSEERGVRLVVGRSGSPYEGNALLLYWLVDRDDGTVIDARWQAFGQTALLVAADVLCELSASKNYDQAQRISSEMIDKQLRDKPNLPAFPPVTVPHLQLALEAQADAGGFCSDLPLPSAYVAPPVPPEQLAAISGNGYPGWLELTHSQQIALLEQVLDSEVRPYIAMDAGGVDVVELQGGLKVVVAYSGSCTSCFAAAGTTLSFIQQVLRAKLCPDISVEPRL